MPEAQPVAAQERTATRLVIHADDAGMNHGANRAFVELSHFGTITAGSVMVPSNHLTGAGHAPYVEAVAAWKHWLESRPYTLTTMRELRDAWHARSS